jgi:anthraniloyl-CoA monooxygenase
VKIVCVGGGPAGLTFAALAKLRDPGRDVTVLERNPRGVTYGWGVVFSGQLLGELHRVDPLLGQGLREVSTMWQDQLVQLGDARVAHLGGYGYGVSRRRLLQLLEDRAGALGVRIEHDHEHTTGALPDADLVVVADGVNSPTRGRLADRFGTRGTIGDNTYLWLGTPRLFDAFTFGFERTDAGWIWFHAYRFDADASTFIVECAPHTWRDLGLDRASPQDTVATLERIFARHLRGQPLLHQAGQPRQDGRPRQDPGVMPWNRFTDVTNRRWVDGTVALMGDAAHTTHFSIGSGTTFAIEDSIALAEQLDRAPDLASALAGYDEERRAVLAVEQEQARNSQRWYESVADHAGLDPVEFGWSMLNRRWAGVVPLTPGRRRSVYLATQVPPLRLARRAVSGARRAAHTATLRPSGSSR